MSGVGVISCKKCGARPYIAIGYRLPDSSDCRREEKFYCYCDNGCCMVTSRVSKLDVILKWNKKNGI